jgi:regulator of sigma E protease
VPAREAATLALTEPPKVVRDFVVGLGQWIMRKAEGEIGGPKMMMDQMAAAAKRGLPDFLWLLGMISAYLGAFNLIPFPALDGGRLMFLGYEAVTRRKANAQVETWVNVAGFVMLFGLMIYVTIFKDFGLGST